MNVLGLKQVKCNQQFIANSHSFIRFGCLHNVYHTQIPLFVSILSFKKIENDSKNKKIMVSEELSMG